MLYEIRMHGRGGQGVKSASVVLAEAGLDAGLFIQSFPEYGPERSGAPVKAFNRFSDREIRVHSGIKSPDLVAVMDEGLLGSGVAEGLKKDGILVVNTRANVSAVRNAAGFSGRIVILDASGIAKTMIGRDVPNGPILGAIAASCGIVPLDALKTAFAAKFAKLGKDVVEKNISALERGAESASALTSVNTQMNRETIRGAP